MERRIGSVANLPFPPGDAADPGIPMMLRPNALRRDVAKASARTVGAWPQAGIIGAGLGPNRNGRKW